MIFNEICNNIIEIGVLEVQNEMASFIDYSNYMSYICESTNTTDNNKKNIIKRAFDAIKRMIDKLIEKIQSLFKGNNTSSIDKAINNLKKTDKGKAALSQKREFKVFKNTEKFDKETAQRLMKAKSVDEIERIMSSYRKQRNSTIKVVSIAIGSVATITAAAYIARLKRLNNDINKILRRTTQSILGYQNEAIYNEEKANRYKKDYNNLKKTSDERIKTLNKKLHDTETKLSKTEIELINTRNNLIDKLYDSNRRLGTISFDKKILERDYERLSKRNMENKSIINKLVKSLCEIYTNQAKTIAEDANQQYKFYNSIMKISDTRVVDEDLINVLSNIDDVKKWE